jgi:hypothetical protein
VVVADGAGQPREAVRRVAARQRALDLAGDVGWEPAVGGLERLTERVPARADDAPQRPTARVGLVDGARWAGRSGARARRGSSGQQHVGGPQQAPLRPSTRFAPCALAGLRVTAVDSRPSTTATPTGVDVDSDAVLCWPDLRLGAVRSTHDGLRKYAYDVANNLTGMLRDGEGLCWRASAALKKPR